MKMEKNQNVFFFQSGKKSNDKALILIKMLLFLKTIMASCANQLPRSVLGYDNEDCQDHQFLLLNSKMSCKPLNIALKLSEFTKNGII